MGNLRELFSKIQPYVLMICLQFGQAGLLIISVVTLNHGMNRYVLIVYRNAVAALVLAPFALFLERKTRPKMTLSVFLQILALGFLEPILDQGCAYLGMQYTSATFTSAIMNAVPSVTFVIAWICRQERVKIKELRSQAKLIGTFAALGGALLMTAYKGPVLNFFWSHSKADESGSSGAVDNKHWLVGTLLILIGCVSWSAFYVLQSVTIKKYPAEMSLSSLICLSGTIQGSVIAVAVTRGRPSAWAVGMDTRLLAPVYAGIISSGIAYYVQGLVMKTRGPVFVTAFNPLCMIIVAVLGSIILAEQLHLGSLIGGIIIAIGLYSVVWGKSKDYSDKSSTNQSKLTEAQELPVTTTTTKEANNLSPNKVVIN